MPLQGGQRGKLDVGQGRLGTAYPNPLLYPQASR